MQDWKMRECMESQNALNYLQAAYVCELVSDVVEKTSTRRRSAIPCVVVEKNYDAST